MRFENDAKIQESFSKQAENFESTKMNFLHQPYLEKAVSRIAPSKTDTVWEVAAGTCACGRAISPFVQAVTCLDLTPQMLKTGKKEAEKAGLQNITDVMGECRSIAVSGLQF